MKPASRFVLFGVALAIVIAAGLHRRRTLHRAAPLSFPAVTAGRAARPAEPPWSRLPVTDPVLAETLLPGSTVQYYDIDGHTVEDLERNLSVRGDELFGAPAEVSYQLVLEKGNPSSPNCGYPPSRVTADITIQMPRWVAMPEATDDARQWWSYEIQNLARDAQTKINAAQKEAAEATARMRRADCETGEDAFASVNQELSAAHAGQNPTGDVSVVFRSPGAIAEAPPPNTGGTTVPAPSVGAEAGAQTHIYDLTLYSLNGDPFPLSELRGRTLFLNFWATWCGPCRAEMPSLEALYAKMKDRDIVFAFVSIERAAPVQAYVSRTGLDLPVYVTGGRFPADLIPVLPTTLIIAKDGTVALRHNGMRRWDDSSIVQLLTKLSP